jgi:AcrR family transcriptional regulator
MSSPRSGRRAEAERNDQRILDSARAVFLADPSAPIAAVAQHAGVGISALYRRWPSKEDLLRHLCRASLERFLQAAQTALEDPGDPWTAYRAFLSVLVDAETHSLAFRLAGTFAPDEELYRLSTRAQELSEQLFDRTRAAGALRSDLHVNDIALLLEQLASVRLGDEARTSQLRQRYLTLWLDAMGAPAPSPLPGPAPSWSELADRWIPK